VEVSIENEWVEVKGKCRCRQEEKKEKKRDCRFRPGFSLAFKPCMKASSQRRRVDVFVVGDRVWIIAIRKPSSKSVLCNCVCVDTGESDLLVTEKWRWLLIRRFKIPFPRIP